MARSGFTNSLMLKVLRYLFGGNTFTLPTKLYIGVSSTPINDDGTGVTEPTDPAYARIEIDNNNATWENIPSEIGRRNLINLEWSPATINWATSTYMFIDSTPTGSDVQAFAELTIPKTVTIGDVLRIDATQLNIKMVTTSV